MHSWFQINIEYDSTCWLESDVSSGNEQIQLVMIYWTHFILFLGLHGSLRVSDEEEEGTDEKT